MKNIFLLSFAVFMISCGVQGPQVVTRNADQFKGKYKAFFDPGEQEIVSWYHYVITIDTNGRYVHRTFFPETKQITSLVPYTSASLNYKEGMTKYWWENGQLHQEGAYAENEKTGTWKSYHRKTGNLNDEGPFANGEKNGKWKDYDSGGRIFRETMYIKGIRHGKFIEYDTLGQIINEGLYKADTIFQQSNPKAKVNNENKLVEEMPYLSACKGITDSLERKTCSDRTLLGHIYQDVKYPMVARTYGIEGTAVVSFIVEKDGRMTNIEVIRGLNQDIKNECIRVVRNLPEWEAGMQNGEKVKVQFNLPIKFRLE